MCFQLPTETVVCLYVWKAPDTRSRNRCLCAHRPKFDARFRRQFFVPMRDIFGLRVCVASRCVLLVFFFTNATLGVYQTELNRILPHVQKWTRFENTRPKFRIPPLKCGSKSCLFSRGFITMTSRFKREYLQNETRYKQTKKVLNYEESPTFSQNRCSLSPPSAIFAIYLVFAYISFINHKITF